MFCVVVHFFVKPGFEASFRQRVLANAADSLAHEPGCRTFDVCEGANAGEVLLYELYDSDGAFQEHLKTSHFRAFDAETGGWLLEKKVATYRRLGVRATPATSPNPETFEHDGAA